jgi:hypothetical protein
MEHLRILKLSPSDQRLKAFRDKVLQQDLGVDPVVVNSIHARQQILATFRGHRDAEEIYKFSDEKWGKSNFTEVLAVEEEGQIVSISGNKKYGDRILRLGMHYYTLKDYRRSVRSVLWRPGGFVDVSLKDHKDVDCFFISIFAHNKKLKAWSQRLIQGKHFGQMGVENKGIAHCLRLFKPAGEVIFNSVPQLILYHSPQSREMTSDFFKEIEATL